MTTGIGKACVSSGRRVYSGAGSRNMGGVHSNPYSILVPSTGPPGSEPPGSVPIVELTLLELTVTSRLLAGYEYVPWITGSG